VKPLQIGGLVAAGGVALLMAFESLTRGGSAVVIALLMGVFFVTVSSALVLYLARREPRRAMAPQPPPPPPVDPRAPLSIYTLQPATPYVVRQSFTDYYGNAFVAGERLTFRERHFLPYHGGHTIVFYEKSLYLQEQINSDLIDRFAEYFALAG
jgi:hypothetical protein